MPWQEALPYAFEAVLESNLFVTLPAALGWGRRDQMDLREVRAYPPGIAGQEGQLGHHGMGANEKVGKR